MAYLLHKLQLLSNIFINNIKRNKTLVMKHIIYLLKSTSFLLFLIIQSTLLVAQVKTQTTKTTNTKNIIKTIPIKIEYSNGLELFNICKSGCSTTFDENKEYFWYSEYSKVQSTKGGNGGKLLHGNYKFFRTDGGLAEEKNYELGLLNGYSTSWDSNGTIYSKIKYTKGKMTYCKYDDPNEPGSVEFIGEILSIGSIKKSYNEYNQLLTEEKYLPESKIHVKIYYELTGKIKAEYTTYLFIPDTRIGQYFEYYNNGRIEVKGQYSNEPYTKIKVGTWNVYNENGGIKKTMIYKADISKWENGNNRSVGEWKFNKEDKIWIKSGVWVFYKENGSLDYEETQDID